MEQTKADVRITGIRFLIGANSSEFNKQMLNQWQSMIEDPSLPIVTSWRFFVENERQKAQDSYNNNRQYLLDKLNHAKDCIKNEYYDEGYLNKAIIRIKQDIFELNSILRKAFDPLPDNSSFVDEMEFVFEDGSTEKVNDGINAKIGDLYTNAVNTLQESIPLIEAKIAERSKEFKEITFNFKNAYEKMLFLKFSGLLDDIGERFKKQEGKVVGRRVAKVVAYLTGESFSNINSYLPYLIDENKIGTAHDNLYNKQNIEGAITALVDAGFDVRSAQEMLYQIIKREED